MNLLSLSNEVLLLLHIFSRNSISIPYLQSLMVSCRSLCNIIQASDELWRLKYFERWGNLLIFQPPERNEKVWFMRTTLRCRKIKEVRKVVQSLSSIAYPVGQSPLLVINKLIAGPYPIPEYVQKELEDIIDENMKENKTIAYYARDALVKVRISILDHRWRDFVAQPKSHMSLLEGVVILYQWVWFTIRRWEKQNFVRDFEISLENITERKQQAFEVGKVSNSADPEKRIEDILDLLKKVMFDEFKFKNFPFSEAFDCIQQMFDDCPIVSCAIFQKVARKMDILCEPVFCNSSIGELLLKWNKDSAGSDEDIYIDAYNRRTFKRSRAISIYPTLREQSTSVDSVLIHTMRLLCQNMLGFSAMEVRLYNSRMLGSLIPQDLSVILQYATNCIVQGIHLGDAIQLLQFQQLQLDVEKCCITKLDEQRAQITAAKTVQYRLPSVKFSVGLVVNYKQWRRHCNNPCVIVSWNQKFQESEEWETRGHEYDEEESNDDFLAEDTEEESDDDFISEDKADSSTKQIVLIQDHTRYYVLMVDDHSNQYQLNVPEDSLEFLPAAVAIEHDKIGVHFERFDGRRYVPNPEKRAQFPEDEAFTLSLIG